MAWWHERGVSERARARERERERERGCALSSHAQLIIDPNWLLYLLPRHSFDIGELRCAIRAEGRELEGLSNGL